MTEHIKALILNNDDMNRIITRLSHEILEKNRGLKNLVLIGLRTRGAYLAQRISQKIQATVSLGKHFHQIGDFLIAEGHLRPGNIAFLIIGGKRSLGRLGNDQVAKDERRDTKYQQQATLDGHSG